MLLFIKFCTRVGYNLIGFVLDMLSLDDIE